MSETATTVDTIDAVLAEGNEVNVQDESTSTDTLEAEVVSDTTEEAPAEAPKPAKRGRKSKAERNSERNGQAEVEVQEVPEPQPVAEVSSFNRRDANNLTKKLKGSVQLSVELFVQAYNGRIWLALDYPTWAEYLNAELGEVRPRLPKAQRLELVSGMKADAKMSQQAIADALGIDQKTVSNDLRELREAAAEAGESGPSSESVGLDGRERDLSTNNRRGKPFVEKVTSAFNKLDKAWGDIVELRVEQEWTEEAQTVANRHASDLLRFIHEAQNMLNALPEVSHETVSGEAGADEGSENESEPEGGSEE